MLISSKYYMFTISFLGDGRSTPSQNSDSKIRGFRPGTPCYSRYSCYRSRCLVAIPYRHPSAGVSAGNELLSRVWCGQCRKEVSITRYAGAKRSGALRLAGSCAECNSDVARVIEFEERDDGTYVVHGLPKLTDAEKSRELDRLAEDQKALMKRVRALERRYNSGNLTRKDEAELDRLSTKDLDAVLLKIARVLCGYSPGHR